jgi:hypothetical protein
VSQEKVGEVETPLSSKQGDSGTASGEVLQTVKELMLVVVVPQVPADVMVK